MEGLGSEALPALKIRGSGNNTPVRGRPWNESVSLPATPDSMRAPSINHNRLTNVTYKKGASHLRGYGQRTLAYGTTEVVKQLYTGQLPPAYFNDICYGRRATPREFQYRTPTKQRERELWEPKQVPREQARHVVRDIQDARFRKQRQLEKASATKGRVRMQKTENCLLKQAETMTRGLQAYLTKLDRQKQKYAKSKTKKTVKPNPTDYDE